MYLPNPLTAYRRWRHHVLCQTIRRELFWFTADQRVLNYSDEELEDAVVGLHSVIAASGLKTEEAAKVIACALAVQR